jgi:hypothetical protein
VRQPACTKAVLNLGQVGLRGLTNEGKRSYFLYNIMNFKNLKEMARNVLSRSDNIGVGGPGRARH